MAPDAPAPTYDSHGNEVAEWMISVRYDAVRDSIAVVQIQEAGPYHKARRQTDAFAPNEVEALVSLLERAVRTMGARRLF